MVEAENKRIGECRMVGSSKEDLVEEGKKLREDLGKTKDELRHVQEKMKKQFIGRKSSDEEGCFGRGEKCHLIRNCPK